MKNRLQTLWDEVAAVGGPCPQPEAKDVRRRVNAVLREAGQKHRTVRPVRVVILAAVLAAVLLAGTALAAGQEIPHPFNVLSEMFYRGENAADAIVMMSIDPVSVSDDNYTVTVTSSLADGNNVYFTLIIEALNDEAWDRLTEQRTSDFLSLRVRGSNGYGYSGEADPNDGHTLLCSVSATWKKSDHAAVRLNLMEDNLWLEFPVKPVKSVTVKIHADGQGFGITGNADGGPVNLKTVEVSPLSFKLDYTTAYLEKGCPVVCFLYKDGTVKSQGQLGAVYPSGHGEREGLFGGDERPMHFQYSFEFPAVQDLSEVEAVIFEGMAYPLDGRDPYAVDMSGYIRPFTVPTGAVLGDSADFSVPFFALCNALNIPFEWDEETGMAAATHKGFTLTFTRDSAVMGIKGPSFEDPQCELEGASVYQDGELWVDASSTFRGCWELCMTPAFGNVFADGGITEDTAWVVVP